MKNYTLDDIRKAAEAKYGSTNIAFDDGEVELVNVMRMEKGRRKELIALQDKLGDDDLEIDEQQDILLGCLRLVCRTEKQADILTEALGDDLALIASVFEKYSSDSQMGEASGSQG